VCVCVCACACACACMCVCVHGCVCDMQVYLYLFCLCRMLCQRSWLYLEPIFSSEDINRQLPVESKRYQTMDRIWRKIMNGAKKDPKVIF